MKIGELARLARSNVDTIRYYEREGLLPEPGRSEGNYRIYGSMHLERLTFIRHCRGLDMTLDEIRTLLHFKESPEENCGEVNRLLDEHIGHVVRRIGELQVLEKQLLELRSRCPDDRRPSTCGILEGLSQSGIGVEPTGNHISGVHGTALKSPKV
ncbi:Cd(II)/Pb(II)-responsive transcriptional regulator [Azospira sp. I13]|jgi:Cd(II)/Pb(II)-responsive transcriptional regulator|uniref:Cd(II)/Pb(II)-responsive transcriptional regulator n=1 Tax=unclassified Azospira TaxID=2609269 RepID=UPI000D47B912|nr:MULTISPECIES: Cd(II)/Pb(II)-responsive transcriptional regulator [unclassified Azospira]BBN87643.1 Cd(II)/Pb(II)-responsive transcriptional regulator [Azospira sp. I09]GBG03470.1 Cd(II)/Pb(II)-responsive transcriptional regulator [Azospira sp. I13]